MENADLKWIKKHYGEKFSHLCRSLFPTILEKEGLLKQLISDHFLPSRELYDDIVNNNLTTPFKDYIYSFAITDDSALSQKANFSPEELLDRAGYILYPECETEEDIQKFRHYYYRGEPTPEYHGGTPAPCKGEELCTFSGADGGRLSKCRVWFAVKKNVDEIRREDFKNPRREDDYGTSVISIQFSKGKINSLSIKNRYNHTIRVVNPDATFGNNLDNIIEGLTQAFADTFNLNLVEKNKTFELPGYVQANDGKYYKYNFESNNIYYCPNNIIIDNGEVETFDKENFIVFDNFVLDIKNKTISQYDKIDYQDSFIKTIGQIQKIKRIPSQDGLTIQITPSVGELIAISLNNHNEIVGYSNPNVQTIGDYFLSYNRSLTHIDLPKVQTIGDCFLDENRSLTHINLPKVQTIGDYFLDENRSLTHIDLPKVQTIGKSFLFQNQSLTHINLPNVQTIGDRFLVWNESLTHIDLPNVQTIGDHFLSYNRSLTHIDLPKVQTIGDYFLYQNQSLTHIDLPKVQRIGNVFLYNEHHLTHINLPKVQEIGEEFLFWNEFLTHIDLPNVQTIGESFLYNNDLLTHINLPNVQKIGNDFLFQNQSLTHIDLPKVQTIGDYFLYENRSLTHIDLPNVQTIGERFLAAHPNSKKIMKAALLER